MRVQIVENGRWAVAAQSQIQYSQQRPIDGIDEPRRLPLAVDCSGFVTLCYSWTHDPRAPDPNGKGFSGVGYTGTILLNCHQVPVDDALPGDIVLFGPYTGEHVALVIETGTDLLVASHGSADGPKLVTLTELEGEHYPPTRILRVPGM